VETIFGIDRRDCRRLEMDLQTMPSSVAAESGEGTEKRHLPF